MAGGDAGADPYATPVGLIYVFNLIVGTGALALPKAFSDAGYMLASAVLLISCLVSYINATFILEALSAANAILMARKMYQVKKLAVEYQRSRSPVQERATEVYRDNPELSGDGLAQQPLLPRANSTPHLPLQTKAEYYEINKRTEISQLASLFLNRWGVFSVYLIMAVYLFGDLAIYSAVVPKSLMNVICAGNGSCLANATAIDDTLPCRTGWPFWMTRINVYRLMVCVFTCVVGPFVFVGMTKTKYLQMLTIVARWAAFGLMISFAAKAMLGGTATGRPPPADVGSFAKLFGITVYAFMCHHSLPAIVTPMRRKARLFSWFGVVYVFILVFYLTLSLTGSFAFASVQDVYTLNFLNSCSDTDTGWLLWAVDYFLALYPVITISMNFPVVGVTLSNNLRSMIFGELHASGANVNGGGAGGSRSPASAGGGSPLRRSRSEPSLSSLPRHEDLERADLESDSDDSGTDDLVPLVTTATQRSRSNRIQKSIAYRALVPAAVLIIPVAVSLWTDDVEMLASAVGAYAGVGVQFVIPCLLLIGSRRRAAESLTLPMPAKHRSPFTMWLWPWFMFVWAAATIAIVTVNYIWLKK